MFCIRYFPKILANNSYALELFNRCEHDYRTWESSKYVEPRVCTGRSRFPLRYCITKLWELHRSDLNLGLSVGTLRGN